MDAEKGKSEVCPRFQVFMCSDWRNTNTVCMKTLPTGRIVFHVGGWCWCHDNRWIDSFLYRFCLGRSNKLVLQSTRTVCMLYTRKGCGWKQNNKQQWQASNKQQQSTTQKSNSFWCHSWMIWVMQFKSAHMSQIFKVALLSCHDDLSTCFLVVALL